MERISDWLRGEVRAELFGAFPAGVLNAAAAAGIELWAVESVDENCLRLRLYEGRLAELEELARRSACELRVLRRAGGRAGLRKLLRRPALLLGLLTAALALLASSLFVWDVDVRGTHRLSRGQVLRALEDCGLRPGSFWPGINTDLLRSEVMLRLPEIGWMAVNVSGSRAVVAVVERVPKPVMYDGSEGADLVAARGGLIRRVNVLAGAPAVTAGQTVAAGQLLVGGRLESLTGEQRTVRARGAVMAETWYELTAVCPREQALKRSGGLPRSRFAILFGKRRVNLYFSSGKAIDGCDKIISEYRLGVQGLFSLPIRIVRERLVPYTSAAGSDWEAEQAARRLYRLLESRTEGQILSTSLSLVRTEGLETLTLRAHCSENIARPRAIGG